MDNINVKKIMNSQRLLEEKEELKKELREVENKIENERKTCDHVVVCSGWNGPFQYRDTSFCECLFCREQDPETKYSVIDASYYDELRFSHGDFPWYRNARMLKLQNVAYVMLKDNPEMTNEELVAAMKEHIQKDNEEYKKLEAEMCKMLSKKKTGNN